MPQKHKKPGGDIPYVVPGSVDPEAYEATSKEQKVARRNWARQNDAYIRQELARGRSREQLGIRNKKEEGLTRYRTLEREAMQGFQDPNYEYNWENGTKRNIATSDVYAREKWVPIEPHEMQEYRTAQARGPMSIEDIYRSNANSQLRQWAAANAIKGGSLRQDDHGFYMSGDMGERIDFDQYGNLIDANTGSELNDMFYGDGSNITGYIKSMGYKSPWSLPGATPTTPGATGGIPDQPSASYPGHPPPPAAAGPQKAMPGMGTTPSMALTSMGNSWNRQAMQPRPSTPGTPTTPMGGAMPGMGTTPSMQRQPQATGARPVQAQRPNPNAQPRRITFAY